MLTKGNLENQEILCSEKISRLKCTGKTSTKSLLVMTGFTFHGQIFFRLTCFHMKRIFHIPIGITEYTKEFYIQTGIHFSNLKKLIAYYSRYKLQRHDISFTLRKGVIVNFELNIRTVDRWIIQPQDILINPQAIDEGHFGSIFRGILYREKIVAVKAIKIQTHNNREDDSWKTAKTWEDEIETIKVLQHENIVLLHG